MLAIVCPGQGSQTPGFLAPWLELPGVRERLESLSDVAGLDLVAHGTTSDAETIKDTAVAQPLIVAAGLRRRCGAPARRTPARRRSASPPGTRSARSPPRPSPGCSPTTTRWCSSASAAPAWPPPAPLTPTGMSAVLGGDPDRGRRGARAARPDRRPTSTAPARSSPPARSTSSPPSPPTRRPRPGSSRCRWPAPSTPRHMSPAVEALERLVRRLRRQRPGRHAAVQRRRPGRRRRRRRARPPGHAGEQPGPLGPVHADHASTSASPRWSSSPRPAPSSGSPSARCPASTTLAVKTPDDLEAARSSFATTAETPPTQVPPD